MKNMIVQKITASVYSGPLPDPESFGKYDKVLPGAAERILSLTEKEQEHRHHMEERQLKLESRDSLLGIITGTLLGVFGLVVGSLVAIKAPGTAGAIVGALFGISGVGTIAATIIRSTRISK